MVLEIVLQFGVHGFGCTPPQIKTRRNYRILGHAKQHIHISQRSCRQIAIECIRSCDQKPYLHNETKGGKIAFNPLISKKKDWIELLLFKKWSQKISAAAILPGPKTLQVLVRNQCEITRHGLSNASLEILELPGGIYSTYFKFMVHILPINNKLGPINVAPMASKT